jgi:hypothetical protein
VEIKKLEIMIKEVLEGLSRILGPIATMTKERQELKDGALRVISNALNETYLYYRDIENGSNNNADREAMLAKYWSAAAISIRHFDEELSNTCDHKSEYWINPRRYNDREINDTRIQLDNVRDAYRKLLKRF